MDAMTRSAIAEERERLAELRVVRRETETRLRVLPAEVRRAQQAGEEEQAEALLADLRTLWRCPGWLRERERDEVARVGYLAGIAASDPRTGRR